MFNKRTKIVDMKIENNNLTDLQLWEQTTIEKVCNCTKRTDLESVWNEARKQLGEIRSAIEGKGNIITIATQRKSVQRVRNAVKNLKPTQRNNKLKYWALEQTNSDKGIKNGLVTIELEKAVKHSEQKQKAWKAQRNESKELTIKQFTELESICEKWLESFDMTERTIAIMFFSGRRETEVIKTAQFKAVRGENDTAKFFGQLKKRAGEESELTIKIEKRAKVLKSLKGLREMFPEFLTMDNEEINKQIARKLGETMYKLFKAIKWAQFTKEMNRGTNKNGKRVEVVADVHPHDLRKIYVAHHAAKFNGTESQKQAFIQNLLGHDERAVKAVSHYGNWQII